MTERTEIECEAVDRHDGHLGDDIIENVQVEAGYHFRDVGIALAKVSDKGPNFEIPQFVYQTAIF